MATIGADGVPVELRGVSQDALESYVLSRLRQFARPLALELKPAATEQQVDVAVNRALYALDTQRSALDTQLMLRFTHSCRFVGCLDRACELCVNNPNKACSPSDNFDNCYADNQVLKSKCGAGIVVQMCNQATGEPHSMPGVEVQLSVVDGDAYMPGGRSSVIHELLKSDEKVPLLGAAGAGQLLPDGHFLLGLVRGQARLPDMFIADKNDTFHKDGVHYSSFRLMARLVRQDVRGNPEVITSVLPAISDKFVVKTQRALNDYRKSEYPHVKDDLTKLRHIGTITAQRLKDVKSHLGPSAPMACVKSVEDLRQLMEYAGRNRQCENKLLDLLNMKGKHKHKWEYLVYVLGERLVRDDNHSRVWWTDESCTLGLLYTCKQAQIILDKPAGLLQRVADSAGGAGSVLQAVPISDPTQHEQARRWRLLAQAAWALPSHPGWSVVTDPIVHVSGPGVALPAPLSPTTMSPGPSPRLSNSGNAAAVFDPQGGPQGGLGWSGGSGSAAQYTSWVQDAPMTPPPALGYADLPAGSIFELYQHQQQQQQSHSDMDQAAKLTLFGMLATHSVQQQQLHQHEQQQQQQHQAVLDAIVAQSSGQSSMSFGGLPQQPSQEQQLHMDQLHMQQQQQQQQQQHPFHQQSMPASLNPKVGGDEWFDLQPPSGRVVSDSVLLQPTSHSWGNEVTTGLCAAKRGRQQRQAEQDDDLAFFAEDLPDRALSAPNLSSRGSGRRGPAALLQDGGGAALPRGVAAATALQQPLEATDNSKALYHQESNGRHLPRSRPSVDLAPFQPLPGDEEFERYFTGSGSLDTAGAPLDTAGQAAGALGAAPQGQGSGALIEGNDASFSLSLLGLAASPNRMLSNSFRDSLHLDEDIAAVSAVPFRALKHNDSDSFKHLIRQNLPSPPGSPGSRAMVGYCSFDSMLLRAQLAKAEDLA